MTIQPESTFLAQYGMATQTSDPALVKEAIQTFRAWGLSIHESGNTIVQPTAYELGFAHSAATAIIVTERPHNLEDVTFFWGEPAFESGRQFLNQYVCPECGHEWEEKWDCAVDDTCENCGLSDISPTESDELPAEGEEPEHITDSSTEKADEVASIVRMVVLAEDANGAPSFFPVELAASANDIRNGAHYEEAKRKASEAGYEGDMIAFDASDPAARQLTGLGLWIAS